MAFSFWLMFLYFISILKPEEMIIIQALSIPGSLQMLFARRYLSQTNLYSACGILDLLD